MCLNQPSPWQQWLSLILSLTVIINLKLSSSTGFCSTNKISAATCQAIYNNGGIAECTKDFMFENCCLFCRTVTVPTTASTTQVSRHQLRVSTVSNLFLALIHSLISCYDWWTTHRVPWLTFVIQITYMFVWFDSFNWLINGSHSGSIYIGFHSCIFCLKGPTDAPCNSVQYDDCASLDPFLQYTICDAGSELRSSCCDYCANATKPTQGN